MSNESDGIIDLPRPRSRAQTPEEAIAMLQATRPTQAKRIAEMEESGFPAYTTSAGWLGYSDEKIIGVCAAVFVSSSHCRQLCQEGIKQGLTQFKIKVGADIHDDKRRCRVRVSVRMSVLLLIRRQVVRQAIGYERRMMVDANQRWDVNEAISNMIEVGLLLLLLFTVQHYFNPAAC
jgi:L-fuconate dehydratase